MISRDDLPETPEWQVTPRCCPFEDCATCALPERFELGEN